MYWETYLADTRRLSTLEHGAYMLLIADYWQSGKALPADDTILAKIAGLSKSAWAKIRPAIAAFFNERDGQWFHTRVEKELAAAKQRYERRAAAGHKGGTAKAEHSSSIANQMPHTGIGTEDQVELPTPKDSQNLVSQVTSLVTGGPPEWDAKQKHEAWQSIIIAYAQGHLSSMEYQRWLIAFMEGKSWARRKANDMDRQRKADEARQERVA